MINSPRAAFFGVGIPHGDALGVSSSANRDDFDPGAGLGSSSNREERDFETLAAIGAGSSGDDPNSDMIAEFNNDATLHLSNAIENRALAAKISQCDSDS